MARFGLLNSRAMSREAEATGFHWLWDPAAGGSVTHAACFHQVICNKLHVRFAGAPKGCSAVPHSRACEEEATHMLPL